MSDKPAIGPLSRRAMLLVAGIGLGGAMAGCADIHPEPNNPAAASSMRRPMRRCGIARLGAETEHGDEEAGRR